MNPMIPMIAITGDPNPAKINQFLVSLHGVGIDQVMLYPRSGCEVPYMSDRWFEVVKNFLDGAVDNGMAIWLYDDFNWPSGHCGGKVVQRPEFCLKAIRIRGEKKGIIHSSETSDDYFAYGKFPDLMSPEAVDYFIQCTHEEYYSRFAPYFGTVIQGIFTDEPAISYACGENDMPYYDGLRDAYRIETGRDFDEDMQTEYEHFQPVCIKLMSRRFKTCYGEKLSDWCRSHGIIMTGHMLSDSSPAGAAKRGGNLLDNLTSYMLPGIDEIRTDLTADLMLFSVAEYVRSFKKRRNCDFGTMAELFALGPCDMSYAKRNCMLHFAGCFKIDHYFLAISPLDIRGSAKIKDFFNCFSEIQPDFEGMKQLCADAVDAANDAQKDFTPDLYIRYPFTPYCRDILTKQSDTPVEELLNTLNHFQLQWKYIQEDDRLPQSNQIPVVRFNDAMECVWDNGASFDLLAFCNGFNGFQRLHTAKGELPENLFVRRFDDGDALALNLGEHSLDLCYCGKSIHMEPYDVVRYQIDCLTGETQPVTMDNVWNVTYANPNVIRAMYLNEETHAEIVCTDALPVSFLVRDGVRASLDGCRISNGFKCTDLPNGIREFYTQSEPVMLTCGTHVLTAENDYKYFPAVLAAGDFHAESVAGDICRIVLSKRSDTCHLGEKISDYGKVSFSGTTTVPNMAENLEISGTSLYTKVYLDGSFVGGCCHRPYVFPVPSKYRGKICVLTVEQFSSIGPIFGTVDTHDKRTREVSWRNTPATGKTEFGFDGLFWTSESE